MPEEKEKINLDKMQVFELDQIILDEDKEVAFKFLRDYIRKPKRHKESHRSPRLRLLTMFYVYVIRSKKDDKWYTGYTSNLRKRFKENDNNKISSTKNRRPFELIYYEACQGKHDAFAREKT